MHHLRDNIREFKMFRFILPILFLCSPLISQADDVRYGLSINTDDFNHEYASNTPESYVRYKLSNDGRCLLGARFEKGKITLFLKKGEKRSEGFVHSEIPRGIVLKSSSGPLTPSSCYYQLKEGTKSKKLVMKCGVKGKWSINNMLQLDSENRIMKIRISGSRRESNCHVPFLTWTERDNMECQF
jgi:hypothetical protein